MTADISAGARDAGLPSASVGRAGGTGRAAVAAHGPGLGVVGHLRLPVRHPRDQAAGICARALSVPLVSGSRVRVGVWYETSKKYHHLRRSCVETGGTYEYEGSVLSVSDVPMPYASV